MGLSWFWSAWALVVLPGTGLRQAQPIVPAIAACSLPLTRTILFFQMEYYAPGFRRVAFVDRSDLSASVVSALVNDFAEITIPASGNVLKDV